MQLNLAKKRSDGLALGKRFVFYKKLREDIRGHQCLKKLITNLPYPPDLQLSEIRAYHSNTVDIITNKVEECEKLEERMKKLNKRITQSNQ